MNVYLVYYTSRLDDGDGPYTHLDSIWPTEKDAREYAEDMMADTDGAWGGYDIAEWEVSNVGLDPCAECGGVAEYVVVDGGYTVCCTGCGFDMMGRYQIGPSDTRISARTSWNGHVRWENKHR